MGVAVFAEGPPLTGAESRADIDGLFGEPTAVTRTRQVTTCEYSPEIAGVFWSIFWTHGQLSLIELDFRERVPPERESVPEWARSLALLPQLKVDFERGLERIDARFSVHAEPDGFDRIVVGHSEAVFLADRLFKAHFTMPGRPRRVLPE